MKGTFLLILLLTFKSYSQDITGNWDVVSYEDETLYYNKQMDSIAFKKNSTEENHVERLKQKLELIVFSVTYSFKTNGKYVENHPALGEVINGSFEVDKQNKTIVIIDDEGKKDKLKYNYDNGILFVEMKMERGYITLGLIKFSN